MHVVSLSEIGCSGRVAALVLRGFGRDLGCPRIYCGGLWDFAVRCLTWARGMETTVAPQNPPREKAKDLGGWLFLSQIAGAAKCLSEHFARRAQAELAFSAQKIEKHEKSKNTKTRDTRLLLLLLELVYYYYYHY